jgi:hypothetical protein
MHELVLNQIKDNIGVKDTGWENIDWIQLAEYKVQRWNILNTAMDFQFHKSVSGLLDQLSDSHLLNKCFTQLN